MCRMNVYDYHRAQRLVERKNNNTMYGENRHSVHSNGNQTSRRYAGPPDARNASATTAERWNQIMALRKSKLEPPIAVKLTTPQADTLAKPIAEKSATPIADKSATHTVAKDLVTPTITKDLVAPIVSSKTSTTLAETKLIVGVKNTPTKPSLASNNIPLPSINSSSLSKSQIKALTLQHGVC